MEQDFVSTKFQVRQLNKKKAITIEPVGKILAIWHTWLKKKKMIYI